MSQSVFVVYLKHNVAIRFCRLPIAFLSGTIPSRPKIPSATINRSTGNRSTAGFGAGSLVFIFVYGACDGPVVLHDVCKDVVKLIVVIFLLFMLRLVFFCKPSPPLRIYCYIRLLFTCHTSLVTRHLSHATRHTSHVTRHTSHVAHHTSHVTRHTLSIRRSVTAAARCSAQRL